jgi:hypothetical protein
VSFSFIPSTFNIIIIIMAQHHSYSSFVSYHAKQLQQARVPECLWPDLYDKLMCETFDVGSAFTFELDETQPIGLRYKLTSIKHLAKNESVYLIDHMWTFENDDHARTQLRHVDSLRHRLISILELDIEDSDTSTDDDQDDNDDQAGTEEDVEADGNSTLTPVVTIIDQAADASDVNDQDASTINDPTTNADDQEEEEEEEEDIDASIESIMNSLWRVRCSITSSDGQTLHFVRDEVGSRLTPVSSIDSAALRIATLWNHFTSELISFIWPVIDIDVGVEATCAGLSIAMAKRNTLRNVFHAEPLSNTDTQSTTTTSSSSTTTSLPPSVDAHYLSSDSRVLPALRQRLCDIGYSVANIAKLLEFDDHHTLPVWCFSTSVRQQLLATLSAKSRQQPEHADLIDSIRFFLLNDSVLVQRLISIIGIEAYRSLDRLQAVHHLGFHRHDEPEAQCLSVVQLAPLNVGTAIVATDFFHNGGVLSSTFGFDPVMYVGTDTVGLLAATPRPASEPRGCRVLDLCSGCGVQAIAALCADSTALLNGVSDRITILHRNVVDFLADNTAQFDMLLANPPYIPSAGAQQGALAKFGDGGPMGDDILAAIIAHIPTLLAADAAHKRVGRFYIVSNLVNIDHYADTVRGWISGASLAAATPTRIHASVLHGAPWNALQYAALVLSLDVAHPNVRQYADGLQQAQVHNVCNGFVIGSVSAAEHASVTVSQELLHDEIWLAVARDPALIDHQQLSTTTTCST